MSSLKPVSQSAAGSSLNTDPRAAVEAMIRRAELDREKKEKRAEQLRRWRNSFKTQKTLKEECEQQFRKAQMEWYAWRVKQIEAWKMEDEAGPVVAEPSQIPDYVHYCEDKLTISDFSLMGRLKISQKKYGKLPSYLVDSLKNLGANEIEPPFKTRVAAGLKKIVGKGRAIADHGWSPQDVLIQRQTAESESSEAITSEVEDDKPKVFKRRKRPVILIFVHPNVPNTHAVQDLARDFVDMIKAGKMCDIDVVYQYEDLQLLGRSSSSQQPPLTKVQRFGGINVINIQNYHQIATTETAYDSEGKLIKIPRWRLGHSQKDYSREDVIDKHIMADAKCDRVFIITDRIKPENADTTIQLYRDKLLRKTERRVMTVYINCKAGGYRRCMLVPLLPLAPNTDARDTKSSTKTEKSEKSEKNKENKEMFAMDGSAGNKDGKPVDNSEGPGQPRTKSTDTGVDLSGEA